MSKEFTIGITTFPRRFEMFKRLVLNIRSICDYEIVVQVNQFHKIVDEEYRKNILKFCSEVPNVYLTIYSTFTSLSKMWNTIAINSINENILSVSDDVNITDSSWFDTVKDILKDFNGFNIINNTFATFLISKKMINDMNYFDERLLAYGEEDGDFVWRYIKMFGYYPKIVSVGSMYNIGEGYGIEPPNLRWLNPGNVIRPAFNREFCFNEKYKPKENCPVGMFGISMESMLENSVQYPYEKFKFENFGKL